jgi:hypothetical protein
VWGEEIRLKPEQYFDLGEHTLVFTVMHGRGRQSGAEVAMPTAQVAKWRDGVLTRFTAYAHREDALRDLGVSRDALEPNRTVTESVATPENGRRHRVLKPREGARRGGAPALGATAAARLAPPETIATERHHQRCGPGRADDRIACVSDGGALLAAPGCQQATHSVKDESRVPETGCARPSRLS